MTHVKRDRRNLFATKTRAVSGERFARFECRSRYINPKIQKSSNGVSTRKPTDRIRIHRLDKIIPQESCRARVLSSSPRCCCVSLCSPEKQVEAAATRVLIHARGTSFCVALGEYYMCRVRQSRRPLSLSLSPPRVESGAAAANFRGFSITV